MMRGMQRSESTSSVDRDVAVALSATIVTPASLVLSVAVAGVHHVDSELFVVEIDGRPVSLEQIDAPLGTRLHETAVLSPGRLTVRYEASVRAAPDADDPAELPPTYSALALERIIYLRPSRYCESDRLAPVAQAEFFGLEGHALLVAVTDFVGAHLAYVSGSSRHTDGAVATYLAREGVCRDFAHLVVAFLRARDVPARVVSVYAPGLDPMDFHAVAEAFVDGAWHVVDPTRLAPRTSMVRIATGRDAADIAFMTVSGGSVELNEIEVFAIARPDLPYDDAIQLVQLT
jgi:transglutaminase-like putative cysteine protease